MVRWLRNATVAVLGFTVAVIVFGAYVRAIGAGGGCGASWPLCDGDASSLVGWHRASSVVDGLLVVLLAVLARTLPKTHPGRMGAAWAVILVIAEGLAGALLAVLGHVAQDQSTGRGVTGSVHLVLSFLLLASLSWLAFALSGGREPVFTRRGALWLVGLTAGVFLIVGVTGAIVAVGDTLFPAGSFAQGLAQERAARLHPFVKLRVWHPVAAILLSLFVIVSSVVLGQAPGAPAVVRRAALVLGGLFFAQIGVGLANVLLAAPVVLQLVHLALAAAVWIAFVVLVAGVLERPAEAVERAPEAVAA